MTLTETVNTLKDFVSRIEGRYNRNLGSPYYFFTTIVYGLLNGNALLEDYNETDDLELIRGKAKIMFNTYGMRCPSKKKSIWENQDSKHDFKILISIFKRIITEG